MDVELITIGDELLLGFTIDTNAAHLARELASIGIGIRRRATVGDVAVDIVSVVREAIDRTGAVITTGGLGPTSEDRKSTRLNSSHRCISYAVFCLKKKNLKDAGLSTILFLGSEYWLWRAERGDSRWIDTIKAILREEAKPPAMTAPTLPSP